MEVTVSLTEVIILEAIAIELVITARTIIVPANALSFLVAIPCTSLYNLTVTVLKLCFYKIINKKERDCCSCIIKSLFFFLIYLEKISSQHINGSKNILDHKKNI